MSVRVRCRSCQAAFVTSDDQVGQTVNCPKCDAPQLVRAPKVDESTDPPLAPMKAQSAAPVSDAGSSIFLPKDKKAGKKEPGKSRSLLWAALLLVPIAVAVGLIVYPWSKRPRTMVEGTAYDYLDALARGDNEAVNRLGVVEEPPAIRSFRGLERDQASNARTKGDFTAIGRLHRSIEKKFVYDAKTGRFTPKDPLGPAAETLDALHDAKAKAEKDGTYKKMASGDPEEQMQAAIDFGGVFTKLSEGILSPKKLIPSYRMLVEGAKPPLTGPELALALDYAAHREVWDALLKRPFPTLKAQGPFQFEKAELTASVTDKLASSGDPPTTVRLRLVRFRMDAIDTGWKVVAARRVKGPSDPFEPELDPDPAPVRPEPPSPGDLPKPSPGEIAIPPELIPGDLPRR